MSYVWLVGIPTLDHAVRRHRTGFELVPSEEEGAELSAQAGEKEVRAVLSSTGASSHM